MKNIKLGKNSLEQGIFQYLILFDENTERNLNNFEKSNTCVFLKEECQSYIHFRIEDYILLQAPPSERESFLKYCRYQEMLDIAEEKDYLLELNQISLEWSRKVNISLIDVLEVIKYLDINLFYELCSDFFDIIENEIYENHLEYLILFKETNNVY